MTANKAILVNSFGRGGSNLLMNLIASSPDVQIASKEFWQFYYRRRNLAPGCHRRFGTNLGSLVAHLYFNTAKFRDRLARDIEVSIDADLQLRHGRRDQTQPPFVQVKVAGYDIFLNARIEACFEEVKFIGLVRNGYGLCEAWERRGTPAAMAGRMYAQIAGRMLREQGRRENYRIVRFEDMLKRPDQMIDKIYRYLGLSPPGDGLFLARLKGFGPGQENAAAEKRSSILLTRREWCAALSADVNSEALGRMTPESVRNFNRFAAGILADLGYEVVGE